MYDYIEGSVECLEKDYMTIGACGIGYRIVLGKASPLRSAPLKSIVRAWTELIIREDKHELYGFSSVEERRLFCVLQNVSGIGPKAALTISNATERQVLIQAIAKKDPRPLQELPGIGKKLAERIVVELHEKISKVVPVEITESSGAPEHSSKALLALKTLGFKEEDAKVRIKKVLSEKTAPKTFEELIQRALQANI